MIIGIDYFGCWVIVYTIVKVFHIGWHGLVERFYTNPQKTCNWLDVGFGHEVLL